MAAFRGQEAAGGRAEEKAPAIHVEGFRLPGKGKWERRVTDVTVVFGTFVTPRGFVDPYFIGFLGLA
jgi:hypothetical protein